jgi:plasmid stabilization system protein ParE
MALKARWTPEAVDTFNAIIEYLENKWTEKEVQSFVQRSQKIISQIEKNPYHFKSSGFNEIRIAFITMHNSILYRVNEQDGIIELYTFWDNRKDPQERPY